jgi:hypothetical protein
MNGKTILKVGIGLVAAYGIYTFIKMRRRGEQKASTKGSGTSNFTATSGDDFFNNLTASGTPSKAKYIAGGYDPNHVNPDGTRGATWISLGGSGSSGYWSTSIGLGQYVAQGTVVTPR